MNPSSCKAKGRRAAAELKALIISLSPELKDDDILVTSSGVTGEDLVLSPCARAIYPVSFECKNTERLNIWQALEQAHDHGVRTGFSPIVAFKRNRTEMHCVIKVELLIKLLRARFELEATRGL